MPSVNTPLGTFRFNAETIRDFCGGMHFFGFSSGLHVRSILNKLIDGGFEALSEEEKEQFATYAELIYIQMVKSTKQYALDSYRAGDFPDWRIKQSFQTRMQWWDVKHRVMYWVGMYFKAGAGKEFINPNSGNTARFFLMPTNWNRYKKLCKKHNVSLTL